jgi:hypothetical protein
MELNKKNLMLLGIFFGVMLYFIGLGSYIALGPSTETYELPRQVSAVLKLSGMGLICISMIVGGFFIDDIDKNAKILLLIFGLFFLLINIFVISYN